jgi:hypothetical protein
VVSAGRESKAIVRAKGHEVNKNIWLTERRSQRFTAEGINELGEGPVDVRPQRERSAVSADCQG